MPFSYGEFKTEIRNHIVDNFGPSTRILDVGPGSGSYGNLLKPHYKELYAIEIHEPYINMFNLREIYREVYLGNIISFDLRPYDYIILGDVLEHLTQSDALELLAKIKEQNKKVLVAVPYQYEQGEEYGNIYETHHQPDLTIGVMYQRYPDLRLIYGNNKYGYFINYIPPIK